MNNKLITIIIAILFPSYVGLSEVSAQSIYSALKAAKNSINTLKILTVKGDKKEKQARKQAKKEAKEKAKEKAKKGIEVRTIEINSNIKYVGEADPEGNLDGTGILITYVTKPGERDEFGRTGTPVVAFCDTLKGEFNITDNNIHVTSARISFCNYDKESYDKYGGEPREIQPVIFNGDVECKLGNDGSVLYSLANGSLCFNSQDYHANNNCNVENIKLLRKVDNEHHLIYTSEFGPEEKTFGNVFLFDNSNDYAPEQFAKEYNEEWYELRNRSIYKTIIQTTALSKVTIASFILFDPLRMRGILNETKTKILSFENDMKIAIITESGDNYYSTLPYDITVFIYPNNDWVGQVSYHDNSDDYFFVDRHFNNGYHLEYNINFNKTDANINTLYNLFNLKLLLYSKKWPYMKLSGPNDSFTYLGSGEIILKKREDILREENIWYLSTYPISEESIYDYNSDYSNMEGLKPGDEMLFFKYETGSLRTNDGRILKYVNGKDEISFQKEKEAEEKAKEESTRREAERQKAELDKLIAEFNQLKKKFGFNPNKKTIRELVTVGRSISPLISYSDFVGKLFWTGVSVPKELRECTNSTQYFNVSLVVDQGHRKRYSISGGVGDFNSKASVWVSGDKIISIQWFK